MVKLSIILCNHNSILKDQYGFRSKRKLISDIEIFLMDDGSLKNFIAKGTVNNLKAEIFNDLNLNNASLSFFADKNDVLIKNISGNLQGIKITEGDLKLNFENGIKLNSNFNSKLNLNKKIYNKFSKILDVDNYISDIINICV